MVNDTLISGGIKYYDELKSDLEDEEYTKYLKQEAKLQKK